MEKVANILTDYVIQNGVVDEEDRNIYEYGFTITIEVGLFVLFCLFITIYLHMFMEGILFFVVFTPLRSYAGGLHLEKYHSCFILSCLTYGGTLLIVRFIHFSVWFSAIALFVLEIVVYVLYPVENINRKVDLEEDRYFRKKLKLYLLMDMVIAAICIIFNNNRALFLMANTVFMVAITMLIGKYKNSNKCLTSE